MKDYLAGWLLTFDTMKEEYKGITRFWSGPGLITINGLEYLGVFTESGSIIEFEAPEHELTGVSARSKGILIINSQEQREILLQDFGPIPFEVQLIYTNDRAGWQDGSVWTLLPVKFRGRLSNPQINGNRYEVEIETQLGDLDRGETRFWSDADQQARYPGDLGLSQMTQLASTGVNTRWPYYP